MNSWGEGTCHLNHATLNQLSPQNALGQGRSGLSPLGKVWEREGAWLLTGCENGWVPRPAHSHHLPREQAWGWGRGRRGRGLWLEVPHTPAQLVLYPLGFWVLGWG